MRRVSLSNEVYYSKDRTDSATDDPRGTISSGDETYYLLHESGLIKDIKQPSLYKWRKRELESEQG